MEQACAAAAGGISFDAVEGEVRCGVSAELDAAASVRCQIVEAVPTGLGLGTPH